MTRDDIRERANLYATSRVPYALVGLASTSFLEGAEYGITLNVQDDFLSNSYSSLKVNHWEVKRERDQLLRDNKDLRKQIELLRGTIDEMSQKLRIFESKIIVEEWNSY